MKKLIIVFMLVMSGSVLANDLGYLIGGVILGSVMTGHTHHRERQVYVYPTQQIYVPAPVYPVYVPPVKCVMYPIYDQYGRFIGHQQVCQ
jgi:hypothetical protein